MAVPFPIPPLVLVIVGGAIPVRSRRPLDRIEPGRTAFARPDTSGSSGANWCASK